MLAFLNLLNQYKNDFLESQKLDLDLSKIKSLCICLGPYRNLTTLTGSLLFLHPTCQVLNHAALRILPFEKINFLFEYSDEKFNNFIKYGIYLSKNGTMGDLGGSITYSHAFQDKTLSEIYKNRFNDLKIKKEIEVLFWKDSMRVTNYIKKMKINTKIFVEILMNGGRTGI